MTVMVKVRAMLNRDKFCYIKVVETSKKILILYTSVGQGHKSIAENIGYWLERAGFKVKLADIGKVQQGRFEASVTATHRFINQRLPFVWGFLYDWGYVIILPLRVFIAGFNYKLAKSYVDDFSPDLIITTQTSASAVVAYLKKRGFYTKRFAVAFSDFHLHRFWLYNESDFYLVNVEEQKSAMVKLGVPAAKIFICGMMLKPRLAINIQEIKDRLNILPGDKVTLVAGGSLGAGLSVKFIGRLANLPQVKVIVVCGKNKNVYEKFKSEFFGKNVLVFGYYSPMEELYAIADIFITKPGGLSVSEALGYCLPILVNYLLPGQEKYNFDYLLSQHLIMPKTENLLASVLSELRTGVFKRALKANNQINAILGKPEVLADAVTRVLV